MSGGGMWLGAEEAEVVRREETLEEMVDAGSG